MEKHSETRFLYFADASAPDRHTAAMRTVGDGVASLQHSLSGREDGFSPRLAAPLTEAAQGVNAYAGQFAGIVGERRALGVRENDGLQGRLRAAAAEVEAEVPAENDAVVNLVLQLRR